MEPTVVSTADRTGRISDPFSADADDILGPPTPLHPPATSQVSKATYTGRLPQPHLPKLSAALKARYDATLDRDYWGMKVRFVDDDSGKEVVRPLVVVNKKSLNFWKRKDGTTFSAKLQTVRDLWASYKGGEDIPDDLLFDYRKALIPKRIREHNAGLETVYYVTAWDSPVEQLMFDFDNKKHVPDYDTLPAARHLDSISGSQQFIQPSTSGWGTHAYLSVQVLNEDGTRIALDERKRWYKRCVRACRAELGAAGFRCARELDSLKGVAAKVSWQKSDHPREQRNPYYLRYERGGRLAKLPRLSSPDDESRYLNRRIIPWVQFCETVVQLEKKYGIAPKSSGGEGGGRVIVSMTTETDSECKTRVRVEDMLMSTDKQRVALGCVFRFQQLHGRHPGEADLPFLNAIYNRTPTHTGIALTDNRADRFRRAISFSANRPIIGGGITANAAVAVEHLRAIPNIGPCLTAINDKLVKANQRAVTVEDVARVFCYLRNNIVTNDGYVPQTSLLSLSRRERKGKKLSANAVGAAVALLIDLRIIRIVKEPKKDKPGVRGICTCYSIMRDIAFREVETNATSHTGAEAA